MPARQTSAQSLEMLCHDREPMKAQDRWNIVFDSKAAEEIGFATAQACA